MPIPQFVAGEALAATKLQQLGLDDTYTPALEATTANPTLGSNPIQTGQVWINGQGIDIFFRITFGTSPTAGSGDYEITLPSLYPPSPAMPLDIAVGTCTLTDDSTSTQRVGVLYMDPTNTKLRIRDTATQAKATNSNPWAWAAGDTIAGHARIFSDYEGGVGDPDPPAFPINQPWPIDTFVTPTVSLGAGGVEYLIRPGANSLPDWNAALAAMNGTGGNVIRFEAGQHNGEYRVRGTLIAGGSAPNGVPGNHNILTGDAGHVITGVQQGGFAFPAIDVAAASHWDCIGLNIDGSDFAGIRYEYAPGTAASRVRIMGCTITNAEHATLQIQGWFEGSYQPTEYFDVDGCVLSGGTRVRAVPEFNEGIYLGLGFSDPPPEWVDNTGNGSVRRTIVTGVHSDSIELKTEVEDMVVEDNIFASSALAEGSGGTSIPVAHCTLVYANTARPGGDVAVNNVFRRNRCYDLTQDAGAVRPPILVGRGGTDIYSNIVWDCEATHAVAIDSGAGGMGTGTINVDGNTADVTTVSNIDAYGSLTTDNNIPDDFAASFVGPTTGTADADAQGPGSGFAITTEQGNGNGAGRNDATDTAPNSPLDPGALAVV